MHENGTPVKEIIRQYNISEQTIIVGNLNMAV